LKYLQKATKEGDPLTLLNYGIIPKELQEFLLEAGNTHKLERLDDEEYYIHRRFRFRK